MKTFAMIIVSLVIVGVLHSKRAANKHLEYKPSKNGKLNFTQVVRRHGHQCEEHQVITADGYVLTTFHIPGDSRRPVLLLHGGTATSDGFIIRGNGSLGITLARKGFDVWALEFRGSRYSRKHVRLDPDKDASRFFNFSMYEYAVYDIPSALDYVLEKTRQTKLSVIAFSMGVTAFIITLSERPEYNEKVDISIFLASTVYLSHIRGLMRYFIHNFAGTLLDILEASGVYEFLPHRHITPFTQAFCLRPVMYDICYTLAVQAVGDDPDGFEPEFLKTFLGQYPGGVSVKYFRHITQMVKLDKLAKYDYGERDNLKVYGSTEPPEIDFRKVTAKVALLVGKEDPLATVEDNERLRRLLPNVVYYLVHPYEKFNHFDFSWGRHMSQNLFPIVFELLEKHGRDGVVPSPSKFIAPPE